MNIKQYLILLIFGTALSSSAVIIILINIDPTTADSLAFLILYITLFIGLLGMFSSITTLVRTLKSPKQKIETIMKISLRQGIILASLIEAALILSSKDMLSWWMLILLIFCVGILEFIFLSFLDNK